MIPLNAGIANSTGLFASAGVGAEKAQGVGGLSGFFAALLAQGQFGAADTTVLERNAQGVAQKFGGENAKGLDVPVTKLTKDERDLINAIANSLDSISEDDIKQILSLISQTYSVGAGGGGGEGDVESIADGGEFDGFDQNAFVQPQIGGGTSASTSAESGTTFEATIIEFRKEIIQFKEAGISTQNLGSVTTLAQAYEKLGMDPAEAKVKAEGVEAALAAMKKNVLGLIDKLDAVDISSMPASAQEFIMKMRETTFVKEQISITHITRAFASSSALGSVDIASQAIKGEPLIPETKPQPLSVTPEQSAKIAEPSVQQSVTSADNAIADGFEELALKTAGADVKIVNKTPVEIEAAVKVANADAEIARREPTPSIVRDLETASAMGKEGEGALAKAANAARESSAPVDRFAGEYTVSEAGRRIVTEIRHGLLNDTPQGETIMKITGSENGTGLDTLETATGDEIQLDNIDQAVDEAMEAFQGKPTSEGRVDGRQANGAARHFSQNALITQQASLQMRSLANQGGGMAKFMLNPPELGQLEVHLEVTSVNAVKATIIVQTQEVAAQLARDLHELEQSLADSGLDMDKEGFTFKLKGEDDNAEDQQQADGNGSSDTKNASDDDGDIANTSGNTEAGRWIKPDSLIDAIV